jgi:hypothetical protein
VFDTAGTFYAVIDTQPRSKPAINTLSAAGASWTDPVFGTRITRLTDGRTRPVRTERSFKTPSSVHQNSWNASGSMFFVMSTDGTIVPFRFDSATGAATRINPTTTDEGGLTLRFYIEPQFSYVNDALIYGSYNGAGSTRRTIDQYDFSTGSYSTLIDLDTLVTGLTGTYVGWIGSSAGDVERIATFFGGISQDRHRYALVFDKQNPTVRRMVDTVASTLNGVPTNIPLNFSLHAMAIDRSGRYAMLYPTSVDMQAPRSAAPTYLWDIQAGTFTELPLVSARSGGHDTYGYGVRVNKDCCTSSTWDAGQWQLRSLASPTSTRDLIAPVLQPKEIYLSDHPSWHNARPDTLVPFVSATYRHGANTTEWRAWDDEVIAIQTDAPTGTGARVWRLAHHRSNVANDLDPTRIGFWYTPRPSVSPDGKWVIFTSNWEKTLGIDPGADASNVHRTDVFLLHLRQNAGTETPPPTPTVSIAITTNTLPEGERQRFYSATVNATGAQGAMTWSIESGSLPQGMTLDAAAGRISGTTRQTGTWSFAVRVTDGVTTATKTLSIRIRK